MQTTHVDASDNFKDDFFILPTAKSNSELFLKQNIKVKALVFVLKIHSKLPNYEKNLNYYYSGERVSQITHVYVGIICNYFINTKINSKFCTK